METRAGRQCVSVLVIIRRVFAELSVALRDTSAKEPPNQQRCPRSTLHRNLRSRLLSKVIGLPLPCELKARARKILTARIQLRGAKKVSSPRDAVCIILIVTRCVFPGKLEELMESELTDDVIPEYVMVMVTNDKGEQHIAQEMAAFLGTFKFSNPNATYIHGCHMHEQIAGCRVRETLPRRACMSPPRHAS